VIGTLAMTTLLLAAILALDAPPSPSADTVRAVWLADLDPARVQPGSPSFHVSRWKIGP